MSFSNLFSTYLYHPFTTLLLVLSVSWFLTFILMQSSINGVYVGPVQGIINYLAVAIMYPNPLEIHTP
jgi:hypothetical protein